MKILKSFIVALLFMPVLVCAQIGLVDKLLDDPKLIGTGARTVFFVHVYDAELYAPKGHWEKNKPFLLRLKHTRAVEGNKVVDKTFESMRDTGYKDKKQMKIWKAQLGEFLQDVKEGDVSTYYRNEKGHTVFYKNNTKIGTIPDERFTAAFFDIWVSEKSPLAGMYKGLMKNNK